MVFILRYSSYVSDVLNLRSTGHLIELIQDIIRKTKISQSTDSRIILKINILRTLSDLQYQTIKYLITLQLEQVCSIGLDINESDLFMCKLIFKFFSSNQYSVFLAPDGIVQHRRPVFHMSISNISTLAIPATINAGTVKPCIYIYIYSISP